MAGKMRVAAKLLLGASVLTTTGGGAYYYTMHGLTLPGGLRGNPQASASELDAVASAWAEPATKPVVDPALSSPIARSAKSEAALPQKKAAETEDRYALPAPADTKLSEADGSTASPILAPAEKAGDDSPVVAKADPSPDIAVPTATEPKVTGSAAVATPTLAAKADEAKLDENAATDAAAQHENSVTRGQEPKEEPSASVSEQANDISAAFDATSTESAAPAEPKQLTPPAQSAKISESSSLAKKAFGGAPPATAAATGADRYGGAPSSKATSPPSSNGAVVNPFASAGAPAPTSNAAGAKPGRLEPLSQTPGGNTTPLAVPDNSPNALRPLEGTNTASSLNRDVPSKSPLGQLPSSSTAPAVSVGASPYERSLPTTENGPRNNDITPIAGEGTGKPGEKALEGPQQPTLVIQKFAPGEIQVGKPAKFVVQVRNVGAQSADSVTIRDEVPQGTKLISTTPNAANEGNHLVWQIGKLSPGEDRKVEMQLMPTSEGDIGSVATVSYSAQASVKTRCTMPQLAVRMTAANEVMVGSQQHVKIEIRNPGSGDATGVMLFENVPPNVKHAAGPALEFEIGTLHPNETRQLDLVLTAEKAGKVVNTLTAKADGNLQVQQQVEFEVIAPALSVSLNGPERRYLERPATYEVSVENPGTAPARDVQIVTKLPKGMRFVRANNMGEYDPATHAVYWSLAELPKGERGSVELVAMPTETGPQTLQVDGHAQQGLADHKQREIVIEGLAAIMFEVRDLEDPIEVGGETGYEIRVVNQGTKAATNVQVSVDLPPGLKLISAEGESEHKVQDGRVLFEPVAQLAPKADTVFRLKAQGLQPGDQRINVQVNTDDLQQPIRREESTRVFGDQ